MDGGEVLGEREVAELALHVVVCLLRGGQLGHFGQDAFFGHLGQDTLFGTMRTCCLFGDI